MFVRKWSQPSLRVKGGGSAGEVGWANSSGWFTHCLVVYCLLSLSLSLSVCTHNVWLSPKQQVTQRMLLEKKLGWYKCESDKRQKAKKIIIVPIHSMNTLVNKQKDSEICWNITSDTKRKNNLFTQPAAQWLWLPRQTLFKPCFKSVHLSHPLPHSASMTQTQWK